MTMLLTRIATLFLMLPALASAQAIPFSGVAHDSSLPVEITANTLGVDQAAGTAEFNGEVQAAQGSLRLVADKLVVEYSSDLGGSSEIRLMRAFGNVTMTNGAEAAEAEEAIYTVVDGMVRMMGDVLLTQGKNAIAGEILNIDLNAGTALFEGRVTSIFNPAGDP